MHVKNHFRKYSLLFPLTSKRAVEVRDGLALWMGQFGIPKIVQSDNGKEFKGVLCALLLQHGIQIING